MTDARIKVDVNTRQAAADLRSLQRAKGRAQKRHGDTVRRRSRLLARAAGFAGGAMAFARFGPSAPSGMTNDEIADEAAMPYLNAIERAIADVRGSWPRATRAARERTKAAFAYQVGQTGELAKAREFYNTAQRIQNDIESGRNLLRADPRYQGATAGDWIDAKAFPFWRWYQNANALLHELNPFMSNMVRFFLHEVEHGTD